MNLLLDQILLAPSLNFRLAISNNNGDMIFLNAELEINDNTAILKLMRNYFTHSHSFAHNFVSFCILCFKEANLRKKILGNLGFFGGLNGIL